MEKERRNGKRKEKNRRVIKFRIKKMQSTNKGKWRRNAENVGTPRRNERKERKEKKLRDKKKTWKTKKRLKKRKT